MADEEGRWEGRGEEEEEEVRVGERGDDRKIEGRREETEERMSGKEEERMEGNEEEGRI